MYMYLQEKFMLAYENDPTEALWTSLREARFLDLMAVHRLSPQVKILQSRAVIIASRYSAVGRVRGLHFSICLHITGTLVTT